jgi:hypothetical protein
MHFIWLLASITMRLIIIIILFSFNTVFAQKTLLIQAKQNDWSKTDGIVVKQKTSDYYNYLTWVNDSLYILNDFNLDSITIEVKNHIPYFISGLSKISTDTILIKSIRFYHYIPEVKSTSSTSKKRLFKKEFRKKETSKIHSNPNSLDKVPLTIRFTINDIPVQAELETTPLTTIEIACNPGKNSFSTERIEILAEFKCIIK